MLLLAILMSMRSTTRLADEPICNAPTVSEDSDGDSAS